MTLLLFTTAGRPSAVCLCPPHPRLRPPRRPEIPPLPLPEVDWWICGRPAFAPIRQDAQLGAGREKGTRNRRCYSSHRIVKSKSKAPGWYLETFCKHRSRPSGSVRGARPSAAASARQRHSSTTARPARGNDWIAEHSALYEGKTIASNIHRDNSCFGVNRWPASRSVWWRITAITQQSSSRMLTLVQSLMITRRRDLAENGSSFESRQNLVVTSRMKTLRGW